MARGFGDDLQKVLSEVKLDNRGVLRAPVRVNGQDGLVVGRQAVRGLDVHCPAEPAPTRVHGLRAVVRRLLWHT